MHVTIYCMLFKKLRHLIQAREIHYIQLFLKLQLLTISHNTNIKSVYTYIFSIHIYLTYICIHASMHILKTAEVTQWSSY